MKAKIFIIFAIFLAGLLLPINKAQSDDALTLLVFYSPDCHRCTEVKKNILPQIEKEFKGKIQIEHYDTTDIKNYAFLFGLKDKYNKDFELTLPVFFINGQLINGKGDVKSSLEIAIDVSLGEAHRGKKAIPAAG